MRFRDMVDAYINKQHPVIAVFGIGLATIVVAVVLLIVARVCWKPISAIDDFLTHRDNCISDNSTYETIH